MQLLLKNPNVCKKKLGDLLLGALQAVDKNTGSKEINNFVKLLVEKKRLNLLPMISELFEASCAKESGCLSLKVTSAFEMSDDQQQAVTEKLSKRFNTALKINFDVEK